MKNSLTVTVFLLLTHVSFAQLNRAYTQYSLMPYMVNPAASGTQPVTDVKIAAKRPFGMDETSSRDYFFGVNHGIIISDKRALDRFVENSGSNARPVKLGMSGFVRQMNFNALTNTNSSVSLAVHVPVTRRYYLGFGLSSSYNQLKVNTQNLIVREIMDTYFSNLTNSAGTINSFDLGSGLVFYDNKLLIGYSVNGLISSRLESSLTFNEKPALTHTLTGGYRFRLSDLWELHPNALVRYQKGLPVFYNISAKVNYHNLAWLGFAYMSGNTVSLLTGYEVSKSFSIGYAYDVPLGNQSVVVHSTNEIVLGFKPFLKSEPAESPTEE